MHVKEGQGHRVVSEMYGHKPLSKLRFQVKKKKKKISFEKLKNTLKLCIDHLQPVFMADFFPGSKLYVDMPKAITGNAVVFVGNI